MENLGISISMAVLLLIFHMTTLTSSVASRREFIPESKLGQCNFYDGEWVYDKSLPLYDSSKCSLLIPKEFDCLKNGRPDREFLKYRWQPKDCYLPQFDGVDFLGRIKGKKMLFVGDSLSENQWGSLTCLLKSAIGERSQIIQSRIDNTSTVTFQEYNSSVNYFSSQYLVDIENTTSGRTLNLDSIKDGEIWRQYDVLIFNTWHWWYRSKGPKELWDVIKDDGKIVQDMNRMDAFRKALTTWANWVSSISVKPTTKVLFQGISPSHYNGKDWNTPGVTCEKEMTPLKGSIYPSGEPLESKVLKEVLNTKISSKKPVHLLDITLLSQLRKDGHPTKYNKYGSDCTHWCIPGVVDTWNHLLYTHIVQEGDRQGTK
ncbi:protein trichome birefringence-like 38 [Andrographis paniculata]|uniref:protein trichome birefringence-like 38 n=1 Tax=Andrographis paniculata TaxID=175694 RepID=UPI0021E9926A|nr:protein trichome birefringence-like 38 [Andrographis paniculata]